MKTHLEVNPKNPGPSCKIRPIRAAKANDIGKSSELMEIENEEERKMGLEDKRQRQL